MIAAHHPHPAPLRGLPLSRREGGKKKPPLVNRLNTNPR